MILNRPSLRNPHTVLHTRTHIVLHTSYAMSGTEKRRHVARTRCGHGGRRAPTLPKPANHTAT
eukprot:1199736-Rhodomonas_salina.1